MRMLRLYARVMKQLAGERRVAVLLTIANLLLALGQFAEPVLFGRVIDVLTRPHSGGITFGSLLPLVAAWVVFGLFNIGAGVTVALHADKLSHRHRLAVLGRYFEHVLSLPLSFHMGTHSGRVATAMWSGSDAMGWLWLGFFREHCAALVGLCVLLPLTLLLNLWLGLLLLCLVFAFAWLMAKVVRHTQDLQSEVRRFHKELAEHTSDALGNLPVVQSFTRVEAELKAVQQLAHRLLEAQIPVLSWWAVAAMATRAAATLTATAILLLGAYLVSRGEARVGEVVTFMTLASMLIGRLESTLGFVSSLFVESTKISEFFSIMDTVPEIVDRPSAYVLQSLSGQVRYEDVSFSYDGRRMALSEVSFEARPGQRVALVGATGSGKSTTLSLLYRAHDPTAGRIVIDGVARDGQPLIGVDVRECTLSSLRCQIAVVFQEAMLFARSIRENMLVGKPDATDEQIRQALARAQALEFVDESPDGLDTVLGERGRSLSGGERQRLSIARALLKDPPILVLDEATSALDATTEQKLKLAFDELLKGRTTFIIAHRLATVRNADTILVFERGRVVESGSFERLVAGGGRFAALARAQLLA